MKILALRLFAQVGINLKNSFETLQCEGAGFEVYLRNILQITMLVLKTSSVKKRQNDCAYILPKRRTIGI